MSMAGILDVAGCLFLVVAAAQVFTTIKIHRGLSVWAIRQMSRVSLGGPKALLLFGAVVGLASVAFQPLLPNWIPPFPPLLVIGGSLLALNGACLPPTFLFLSASRGGGFSLAREIQSAVAPLEMVHLLDTFEAGAIVGESLHHSMYRVTNNWQRAVRTLAGITPVIIVDLRDLTPNVYREVVHLVETNLHERAVFIAESTRLPPGIAHLCHHHGVRMSIVTPELLEAGLVGIGWTVLFRRVENIFRFLEMRMMSIGSSIS